MHMSGSSQLKEAAADILNHLPSTSHQHYQNFVRGRKISRGKQKFFNLHDQKETKAEKRKHEMTCSGVVDAPGDKVRQTKEKGPRKRNILPDRKKPEINMPNKENSTDALSPKIENRTSKRTRTKSVLLKEFI